jgi:hypothetical protein
MKKLEINNLFNIYNKLLLSSKDEKDIISICNHLFYLCDKLERIIK